MTDAVQQLDRLTGQQRGPDHIDVRYARFEDAPDVPRQTAGRTIHPDQRQRITVRLQLVAQLMDHKTGIGKIGRHRPHQQPHFECPRRVVPPADVSVLTAKSKDLHPFFRRDLPCMVGIQRTRHRRLADMRHLRDIRTRNFLSHCKSPFQ